MRSSCRRKKSVIHSRNTFFSRFSSARIGQPAATRPTIGTATVDSSRKPPLAACAIRIPRVDADAGDVVIIADGPRAHDGDFDGICRRETGHRKSFNLRSRSCVEWEIRKDFTGGTSSVCSPPM